MSVSYLLLPAEELEETQKKAVSLGFPKQHHLFEKLLIKLAELKMANKDETKEDEKKEKKRMDPYSAKGGQRPVLDPSLYSLVLSSSLGTPLFFLSFIFLLISLPFSLFFSLFPSFLLSDMPFRSTICTTAKFSDRPTIMLPFLSSPKRN
jgi:hypothetical protein